MSWNPNCRLPYNSYDFESQNNKLMIALKKEIRHIKQERRYKLWQLEYEKRQFWKTQSVVHGGKRPTSYIGLEKNHKNNYTNRWVTAEFDSKGGTSLQVEDVEEQDDVVGVDGVENKPCPDTTDKQQPPVSVLPTIVISSSNEDRKTTRQTPDTFVTKVNEDDDSISTVDLSVAIKPARKNSCIETCRKLSLDVTVPPRLRSTSLPLIARSASLGRELALIKRGRSKSMDTPNALLTRRSSEAHQLQGVLTVERSTTGLSKSRVIAEQSRGIMYRDLDERRGTLVSDQQWEELKKCRYLRGPDFRL